MTDAASRIGPARAGPDCRFGSVAHRANGFRWSFVSARRLSFALAVCLAATGPATAQTAPELASVRVAIEQFNAAFETGDYAVMLSAMPPRVLERIASRAGMSPEALLTQLEGQMAALMSQVTIEDFTMDVADATWGETTTGLTYALVPTETILRQAGAGRMRSETTTLALQEEDEWYLVRIDNAQQITMLRDAYPEFGDVTFPSGRTEILD